MKLNHADYFTSTGTPEDLQAAAKKKRNSRPPPKKRVEPCDTAGLPNMGDRVKAVCGRCCYRGHVVNSTKTCPFAIALEAIQKHEAGQKYQTFLDKYETAIAELRLILAALNAAQDSRATPIQDLVSKWDEMREQEPPRKLATSRSVYRHC